MARFYARIEPDPALARGYIFLLDAIAAYTARGDVVDAAATRAILNDVWQQFERLGPRAAAKADEFIRARIASTQVRPDASGRMRGAVISRPMPSTFPAGALGIADLDELDRQVVNPTATGAGSYWRAQEYGTTAHVGRRVPGYFQPGQSRPSAAEFRVHPYFGAVLGARGTPAMVIKRPLEARHFLRDGADKAVAWHVSESSRILAGAVSRLRTI